MRVVESIRGPLHAGDTFDDVELGGAWGAIGLSVPGAPRFTPGERVLLFLQKNDRGEWAAKSMALGKFTFAGELLLRDANEVGPRAAPRRREVSRIRTQGRARRRRQPSTTCSVGGGGALPPHLESHSTGIAIGSYLLQCPGNGLPMRWPNPSATFFAHGTQPGALNSGVTSLQRGVAAWINDPNRTSSTLRRLDRHRRRRSSTSDGVNSVQFNDPSGEIAGTSPAPAATFSRSAARGAAARTRSTARRSPRSSRPISSCRTASSARTHRQRLRSRSRARARPHPRLPPLRRAAGRRHVLDDGADELERQLQQRSDRRRAPGVGPGGGRRGLRQRIVTDTESDAESDSWPDSESRAVPAADAAAMHAALDPRAAAAIVDHRKRERRALRRRGGSRPHVSVVHRHERRHLDPR